MEIIIQPTPESGDGDCRTFGGRHDLQQKRLRAGLGDGAARRCCFTAS